ncbi:hypothetical protein MATL_G00202900 [Megalops atlanticus]|uniref:Mitochondrial fission regulator n=1 Tax=Megalops atlanticus TaxID=7932 RepID=A0A9D3PMK1_MEGAT|nr:hypothetical protein MATL_G00202900 [Megalops atlanticus]
MSLLADILDLLRNLLEYFGVPPDMLVPVWASQYCGQYRSIVRMIGTHLPLTPPARVHFQIPLHMFQRHGNDDFSTDGPAIPSLADVMWIAEDEGETLTKFRNDIRPPSWHPATRCVMNPPAEVLVPALPARRMLEQRGTQPSSNRDAMRKITALEDELLRLRAQIAMIVTAPSGTVPFQSTPSTPRTSPPPPPLLTSTPAPAPHCPPPPRLPLLLLPFLSALDPLKHQLRVRSRSARLLVNASRVLKLRRLHLHL